MGLSRTFHIPGDNGHVQGQSQRSSGGQRSAGGQDLPPSSGQSSAASTVVVRPVNGNGSVARVDSVDGNEMAGELYEIQVVDPGVQNPVYNEYEMAERQRVQLVCTLLL